MAYRQNGLGKTTESLSCALENKALYEAISLHFRSCASASAQTGPRKTWQTGATNPLTWACYPACEGCTRNREGHVNEAADGRRLQLLSLHVVATQSLLSLLTSPGCPACAVCPVCLCLSPSACLVCLPPTLARALNSALSLSLSLSLRLSEFCAPVSDGVEEADCIFGTTLLQMLHSVLFLAREHAGGAPSNTPIHSVLGDAWSAERGLEGMALCDPHTSLRDPLGMSRSLA